MMDVFTPENFTTLKYSYTEKYKTYLYNSLLPPSLIDLSILGLEKLGSGDFYVMYPRLFMEALGVKDEKIVEVLSIAGYLYYQSLMNIDRIYDYKGHSYNLFTLLSLINLQEETIKILSSIFPNGSNFWVYWNRRKEEFLQSLKFVPKDGFTLKQFKKLSIDKTSFAKIALDALYHFNGDGSEDLKRNYHLLLKSHDSFSIALQILDDVQDIAQDALNDQTNIALEKLIEKSLINRSEINELASEDLKKILHYSGTSLVLFRLSMYYLGKAYKDISDIPDCYFKVLLQTLSNKVNQRIDNMNGILAIIEAKKQDFLKIEDKGIFSIPNKRPKNRMHSAIVKGLNYILQQKENGFVDLKHYMFLGKRENFRNTRSVHSGDVFQRSMILEIFCDAERFLKEDLSPYIYDEIRYLIGTKNRDMVKGWSYFQTVREVAADADDLAQVIIAFLKADRELVAKHCTTPINVLLRNNITENGGLETWIIPKNNRTYKQNIQVYFNENNWGTGPDIEVNANILYALIILDRKKYGVVIENGIKYILSQQSEEGLWNSRWYCGNKYATYMILRLFKEYSLELFNVQIAKTVEKLIQNQQNNGGWGITHQEESDPLSTAFALLTLKLATGSDLKQFIKKAEKYLLDSQSVEYGNWQAVEFILPRLNNPYKSKTLTTAIVLKSLIC
jgi:squalene-hopene/tetraprenyl-beta-curcumene cyclase